MSKYNFPVPRSRGIQNTTCGVADTQGETICMRDVIIHLLLGRFASTNDDTWELETIFNPDLNALEIDIPDLILQQIETIGIGPNLQRYLTWLCNAASLDTLINIYDDYDASLNSIILADTSNKDIVITLPDVASGSGTLEIKKIAEANTVTIQGDATIDDENEQIITSKNNAMHLGTDTNEWYIL